jgi:anti-sigma factor ChrR (cupin superfamily)
MTSHLRLDDDLRERAVAYALGALPAGEATEYESHCAACAVCRAEADSVRRLLPHLAAQAGEAEPGASLKGRLLECFRREARPAAARPSGAASVRSGADVVMQPWKRWQGDTMRDDLFLVRAGEGEWEPTAVPGVETRRLYVDVKARRATMLVRMAAHTSYPAHLHGGPEECYVLDGDIRVHDVVMHRGDYQRADLGSTHHVQSTDEGCLLLLVSSLDDEIVGG